MYQKEAIGYLIYKVLLFNLCKNDRTSRDFDKEKQPNRHLEKPHTCPSQLFFVKQTRLFILRWTCRGN